MRALDGGLVDPEHPSGGCSPEMAAAATDDYRLLHQALLALGQKYRTAIILRYFECKSLSAICEITNKREGTVKSHLHRGLSQLKEALARVGVSLP